MSIELPKATNLGVFLGGVTPLYFHFLRPSAMTNLPILLTLSAQIVLQNQAPW